MNTIRTFILASLFALTVQANWTLQHYIITSDGALENKFRPLVTQTVDSAYKKLIDCTFFKDNYFNNYNNLFDDSVKKIYFYTDGKEMNPGYCGLANHREGTIEVNFYWLDQTSIGCPKLERLLLHEMIHLTGILHNLYIPQVLDTVYIIENECLK